MGNELLTLRRAIVVSSIILLFLLSHLAGIYDLSNRLHVFIILYLVIAVIFINLYSKKDRLDFFSPGVGLVILLFLYSLSSALFAESMRATAHGDPVSDDTITIYYYTCIVGLLGITSGTLWAQRIALFDSTFPLKTSLLINDIDFFRKLSFATILLSMLFFAKISPWFNFTNVPSYKDRALALRLERMENSASGIMETFFVNLPITLILCLATYFVFKRRSLLLKSAGLLIMLSYLLRNTMAGWRGHVMAAILIPVIYYHYKVRRINAFMAICAGFFGYLFVNILSFVRSTSNLSEMYALVLSQFKAGNYKFLSLTSSSELLVGTNLLRLISGVEQGETSYTYGLSIISELLVYIPRVLFSDRPLPLSENFVATFYPGVLEEGGGLGFFFLQEGYWISGVSGVFFLTFAYAWILQKIYIWVINNNHYSIVTFGYALIYNVLVLSAVRSGVIANFKNMLMSLIPMLILFVVPTIDIKKIYKRVICNESMTK